MKPNNTIAHKRETIKLYEEPNDEYKKKIEAEAKKLSTREKLLRGYKI